MNCNDVQGLLLEADPEVLAGTRPSPVAEHLRSCEACRTVAGRLLAAHQALLREYQETAPRLRAEETARRALAGARHESGPGRIIRAAAWSLIPLAAAAAVTLTVVARHDRKRSMSTAPFSTAVAPVDGASSDIAVEVPPGRNAIVFKTRDPNISVVWIY